jgi:hypothetical protein
MSERNNGLERSSASLVRSTIVSSGTTSSLQRFFNVAFASSKTSGGGWQECTEMSLPRFPCDECRKMMLEVASATTEALAIREDINTSIHGNRPVSTGKLQFAKNAEMVQNTALKALRAHTKTHREILK